MGLFSKVFSKEKCELCDKEVGALSRVKLSDGLYICSDCRKNTSAFINIQKCTLDDVKKHIEYMKRQNEFYEEEFASLSDNELVKCIKIGSPGIVFADSLAMFEIINSDTKKKNYKELFRYDQIKDYQIYAKENKEQTDIKKKYSETGVKIIMDSAADIANFATNSEEMKRLHPYAKEFIIPVSRNVDNKDGGMIFYHLNELFGIKERRTKTEKAGYQTANDAVNALTSFALGNIDDAKAKMNEVATSSMSANLENKKEYTKRSDEAEVDFMGETFRDFLYKK